MRKYVLDANCYIDASHRSEDHTRLIEFSSRAAPGLFLSTVVAAELRAGVTSTRNRRRLEEEVLGPFIRRRRVVTPGPAAWDALGLTLATLREKEGLQLARVRRSFAFDVLLAYSCRELGAILITANTRDMERIEQIFTFQYVMPYPEDP